MPEVPAADPFSECTYCGEAFESNVRYPVHTEYTDDNEIQLYSFCDPDCKSRWLDERHPPASDD